jgi:hypothetical protein
LISRERVGKINIMTQYKATQIGYSVIGVMLFLAALESYFIVSRGSSPMAFAALVIVAAVGFVFSTMTIEVSGADLSWSVSPLKLFRQRLDLRNVGAVTTKRVSPFSGLGVRMLGNRTLWIVNFGAGVFVELDDGREIALGSADTAGLVAAIESTKGSVALA